MNQRSLFGDEEVQASIPGLVYQPEFLGRDEEQALIAIIRSLPLQPRRAGLRGALSALSLSAAAAAPGRRACGAAAACL